MRFEPLVGEGLRQSLDGCPWLAWSVQRFTPSYVVSWD